MTIQTITRDGQSYTYEELFNLGPKEAVALHNKLNPDAPTKRFADKQSGVKRIWKLLEGQPAAAGPSPDAVKSPQPAPEPKKAEAPKTPKPEKKVREPKARRPRERRFVYPPKDEIKHPANSKSYRATLLRMMSRPGGATFAQLMAATWGRRIGADKDPMTAEIADKTTYEGIRLCHTYVGYGLRQHDGKPTDQCPDGTTLGAIYLIGHGNRVVAPITFDKDE